MLHLLIFLISVGTRCTASLSSSMVADVSCTSMPRSTRRRLGSFKQLREAFPYGTALRYLIFDRDSIFSSAVVEFIKAMGTKRLFGSPTAVHNSACRRWAE
jgi:hypothetical protein